MKTNIDKIDVLDKGYVRLVDHMGTDLSVVNAARASFQKEVDELGDRDTKLIEFMAREGHWSVFRHCFATLEIKAPLEVTRQWWKYVTGAAHTDSFSTAWNEASRRYVTMGLEYYCPFSNQWRSVPENLKQGSGGPLGPSEGQPFTEALIYIQALGAEWYQKAMDAGIAPEMARLFIPAYGMYTTWRWSTSLQGLAFFLTQRMVEEGAQSEIVEYAQAVHELTKDIWEISMKNLVGEV